MVIVQWTGRRPGELNARVIKWIRDWRLGKRLETNSQVFSSHGRRPQVHVREFGDAVRFGIYRSWAPRNRDGDLKPETLDPQP